MCVYINYIYILSVVRWVGLMGVMECCEEYLENITTRKL